jgi:hypothetical protein
MARLHSSRGWVAVALGALMVASCSSSSKAKSSASSGTTTPGGATAFTVAVPQVAPPPAQGKGMNRPQPSPPLPAGYTEDEFFVGGTATSFTAANTPSNGQWTATPGATAPYRTRVIVRRPPADKFSGTVLVEWFNVSAVEANPDWAYLADEIAREGDAYIGVSAQAQGVEGGKTLLNVNVDPKTASSLGESADKSGLKHIDPTRYGTLAHPGDAYAYDIFSQVGKAATASADTLLGGLKPKQVLAVGESQSAAFLTTYVDAVHPLDPVFNGFLIHSRGATGAPLDGKIVARSSASQLTEQGVQIRTDLKVPVFMFETETDLTLLGYSHARQPDSNLVHTWEVAGTSHADSQLLQVVTGGTPHDPKSGSLLGCTTDINTGPQHEVIQAALHQFVGWAGGGAAPPAGTPFQLVEQAGRQASIARDPNGNALGGVRNPMVDVPVATLTGEPSAGTTAADLAKNNGTCILFGKTITFDRAKLVGLYGTADKYVAAFRTSGDKAVAAGFLLRPDADELNAFAERNRSLFS